MKQKRKGKTSGLRTLAIVLCCTMMLSLQTGFGFAAETPTYRDGVYEGSGTGYGGTVTVQLTIRDGVIHELTSPSHEKESFWERRNVDALLTRIVEANSADVDGISGATRSSNGVKAAVRDALAKAADGDAEKPGEGEEKDPTPDPAIFDHGSGSSADPFIIRTTDQMKAFAASQTEGKDYTGCTVRLDADLDISGEDWEPVGGSEYPFSGTFDGAGHTITGLTEGTRDAPRQLDRDNIYIGLFGVLDAGSAVKDLALKDVAIYTDYAQTSYVGGLAGFMAGDGTTRTGGRIDGVSVTGVVSVSAEQSNNFAAGILAYQYLGALINSWSDVDVSCVVRTGDAIAEAGGLVALNNRGLIANDYTLGDVYGSASRNNGDEGMASISALVGVQAGALVNCYSAGSHATGELSYYTGAVSGWVTGIGKSYSCWYNGESTMTIGGQNVRPVESIGTKVASGVNDEGDAYTGGLVYDMNPYTASTLASVADALNRNFAAFPIDLKDYGLSGNELKLWTAQADPALVTFDSGYGQVTYVQPDVEIVPPVETQLRDGIWYGRDEAKTTVVQITVRDHAVAETVAITGSTEGDAFEQALEKAKEKAVYGDTSDYAAPDAGRFAGGRGTAEDPYQIATEDQLRYVAEALNEDNSWEGVYFKQTADLSLEEGDWLPIGWVIYTEINERGTQYCAYPFEGNYDGGDCVIRGLKIGSEDQPTGDPRAQYTAGLFGVTVGEANTNEVPDDSMRQVEIRNLTLEDVIIHVNSRYQNYVAGIAGSAQNGFIIDNCGVSGTILSYSAESFARGGGISANALRGLISNTWADVDVSVDTDAGNAYAGGLVAMDNRVTVVNCYALGDVTGNATNTNKIHIGGLVGQSGGAHYNCYASGNVMAKKAATDVGGLNGRLAGIGVEIDCYYNTDAEQSVAGEPADVNVASGVDVTGDAMCNQTTGKTAEEMKRGDFADLLNENIAHASTRLEEMKSLLEGKSLTHAFYYTGDGTDLKTWSLREEVVGFHSLRARDFEDIDAGKWYYPAVDYVLKNGIMQGMGGQVFAPEQNLSRAMLVQMLYNMEGKPDPEADSTAAFSDVPAGQWYADAISWAAAHDIVNGMGNGIFEPESNVSREQMATILFRYAGTKDRDTSKQDDLSQFRDRADVSDWAQNGVSWTVGSGLMNGMGDGTLQPKETATRAQVAQIFMKFCSMNA